MAQLAESAGTIDLHDEATYKAVEVFDGFWVIATQHHPGLSKHMFEINNRALVFRLEERGTKILLVANAASPLAIPEVQRIERETALAVRYIVSPGAGHHLQIEPWHAAFESATVLLPPARIPRTEHGHKLIGLPRVTLMDPEDPLPAFKGQLEAVLFVGIDGAKDGRSAGEGAPDTMWTLMKGMFRVIATRDPHDELWLFHVASGTVIAGENLSWFYPASVYAKAPTMLRGMVKPDRYTVWDARKVGDANLVRSSWKKVLTWPSRAVMTYHDVPGTSFQGDGRAMLEAAAREVGQLS